eukprot:481784-Hanusia_phi.AAC.3
MIVEYSRIEWVSMGTVTEYLLQDDLMFAHRHQSEGGREEEEKEENQEEEEERNEIGDLLQDGRSGLKGYDGELEPLHEIVERENEKIRNQPDHEDPLMNEILQEQMPWIREGIQEEKEENPNLDFSKFGQYFSQPSTSFLHPTKGATPLQPTPYHDPTSCNQFGPCEHETAPEGERARDHQAIGKFVGAGRRSHVSRCPLLTFPSPPSLVPLLLPSLPPPVNLGRQGGYAKNESDARNLLASQYNATLDQLVYVLEMIDNRFVGDVVEGFQLLERRRQAYLEYDDDDIDQTLLGVGKFNEMCQHLDADYMNKLQKRINETERTSPLQWSELNETAIWKKPTADVMPYAYHSGLIISNEQLVEWERKRKERDERLSSSLLKQAAAFLKAGDGEAALPLQDSEHHAPMLLESQPQDEFNLTVAVGEGGEQYQSSLFYQKINNSLASNAISGRLDTQVKLMQALVEESHKNRRLAARLSKISPDNVGIIESLRPPRNQTEEEEETDLSALDEEIERLESELAKLRMDVDAPKASKTRVKKFNVGERNHEARKGEDVDVVGQMKAKIEQKKAIGDHLSLPMILKKDKEAAGLGNINDLLQGLQTKPSTSENIWTPDIIPKFFANATNGKSDDEIGTARCLSLSARRCGCVLWKNRSRSGVEERDEHAGIHFQSTPHCHRKQQLWFVSHPLLTSTLNYNAVKPEWLQPADLTGLQDSDNETVGEGGDEEQEWDGDLLWTMGKQEDPDANDDFPAVLMENDDTATYGGGGQPCRTQGDEMVVVKEAGSLAGEDWSRSMSAQEVWDIAQGRGQRGNGYTILRNRIYGTIIELYHDSDDGRKDCTQTSATDRAVAGFFRFLPGSALPRDRTDKGEPMWRVSYQDTCRRRWGDFWPRLGFMAHMLVRFIIENKVKGTPQLKSTNSCSQPSIRIAPRSAILSTRAQQLDSGLSVRTEWEEEESMTGDCRPSGGRHESLVGPGRASINHAQVTGTAGEGKARREGGMEWRRRIGDEQVG